MVKSFLFSIRTAALLLACTMLFSATACQGGENASSASSGASSEGNLPVFINPLPELDLVALGDPVKPDADLLTKINEKYNINNDVVGWLTVPGTDINEEVLQGPGPDDGYNVSKSGEYYERRDINKQYKFEGCYFADYEDIFGDRNAISKSTVIYGHSMTDDLEKETDPDKARFTQLKRYMDPEFAKANPYVYFSTPEDEMVWKVFSAMYTDIKLPYYFPNQTGSAYMDVVQKMFERSEIDFGVDVNANDKIIILSTCTYLFGTTEKEHEQYRYLVAARLVRPGEETPSTNPAAIANPDAVRPVLPS